MPDFENAQLEAINRTISTVNRRVAQAAYITGFGAISAEVDSSRLIEGTEKVDGKILLGIGVALVGSYMHDKFQLHRERRSIQQEISAGQAE